MTVPTQREIAERVGVSQTTVSLVLKDPESPRVSKATRRRVLDFVQGNAPALLHRRRAGEAICYLVSSQIAHSSFYDTYYSSVLHGVEAAGRALGRDIVFRTYESPEELSGLHVRSSVGGVLVINRLPPGWIKRLSEHGPVVQVNEAEPDLVCDQVQIDNAGAIRRVVEYLAERGHRRIAYAGICRKARASQSTTALRRFAGYCEGMHACGLPLDESLTWELADPAPFANAEPNDGHARAAARRFLFQEPAPTAVVCFNDLVAILLAQTAGDEGMAVPEDLSIVGFDNIEAGALLRPALTTVEQDREEMGRVAVELLDQRMRSRQDAPPRIVLCGARLVERESVAAALETPAAAAHAAS